MNLQNLRLSLPATVFTSVSCSVYYLTLKMEAMFLRNVDLLKRLHGVISYIFLHNARININFLILEPSGSQPVVLVPLGVREGPVGDTRK
jgi:hypothetical protein